MSLLITEESNDIQCIVEDKNGSKNYFIEGIIMQGDVKNKNGRVYPVQLLEREVDRYVTEKIETNRAFGELNHPDGPTINLDRVSHMFTELAQKGSDVVGRAKVMDTPMGKIVKNLIDEKANLGISSRGMGTLKENIHGVMEVQDDFYLATAGDIVAEPSAPNAFVKGIMEGVNWIYDENSGEWGSVNAYDQIEEDIKRIGRERGTRGLEEHAEILFKRFLSTL